MLVNTVFGAKGYVELDESMMIVYGTIPTGRILIKGKLEVECNGKYMLVHSVDFKNVKMLNGYNENHLYFSVPLELNNIKVLSYDEDYKSVVSG